MEVKILASGSKGNCIWIRSGDTQILIDVGLPKTKIEKILLENGIYATEINAIFITHAHGDHIKGLPFANKYRIPVFAAENEWKSIASVDRELREFMTVGESVGFGFSLNIDCFRTHHDAYDSLGYTIREKGKKVSICLDTGKIDSEMIDAMRGSDIFIIEANHDPAMLQSSAYPDALKARILSDNGHLSNQAAADALVKLVQGKREQIYLTHLSINNNLPALAEVTVRRTLKSKGFLYGKHYFLEVV